jgi:DDE superfamily endonuclease/helix-turn-helix, Psq domain/Tc5 transposase DNA-binding domain
VSIAESSSKACSEMADAFADLSKAERIEKAVKACIENRKMTARKAEKIYNVSHTTILRRIKGESKAKRRSHTHQQLLTPVEERTLVKWVVQYYKWGLPLNLKYLRQYATEILLRKCLQPYSNFVPLIGENWHHKFLNRNPEIKQILARGLDRTRASAALKSETFTEYFELYRSLQQKYAIAPQDIYNMDEKGFCMGAIQRSHVFIPVSEKEAFLRQDGNREWISVIESISGSGETLPSFIIFKAVYQQSSWFQQLDTQSAKIATSSKGWTDNHLGLLWLQQHFEVETAKRQLGEYRLLILDGHESHCTLEFIEFCVEKKIILLVLPPHTTHLLQPLDVAIFQPLAKYYSVEVENHSREKHYWLEKEDFIEYYQNARKKALRESNILSAWRATGILPFNPQMVLAKLPNRPTTPPEAAQIQLILNGSPPIDLLVGADNDYVGKATQAIKNAMLGSPAEQVIKTIEYLNANNAILSKANAQLVATSRARQKAKKGKAAIGKARLLSRDDADKLRAEQEAKEAADIAHKVAIGQKRKAQNLKRAQEEADKAERAVRAAMAKDARNTNAEMARMAKTDRRLFI